MSTKNKDIENNNSSKSLETTTSDNKDSRRNVLKKLAVGGLAAGAAMPAKWSKPVVDAVVLPAHATTSDATIVGGGGGGISGPGPVPENSIVEDVLDFFTSPASAGGTVTNFCVEITVTQNNNVPTSVTCTKVCFNGCKTGKYDQTVSSVSLTGSGSTWEGVVQTVNSGPKTLKLTGLDTTSSTLCQAQLQDASGPVINNGTCNCPCTPSG